MTPSQRAEELTDLLEQFGIIPAHGLVRLDGKRSQDADFSKLIGRLTDALLAVEREAWEEAAELPVTIFHKTMAQLGSTYRDDYMKFALDIEYAIRHRAASGGT